MTNIVSFTDFRDNLSEYIDFLRAGNTLKIENAKKKKIIITLFAKDEKESDLDGYVKFVKSLGGSGLLASKEDEMARKKFRESLDKRFEEAKNY